jgi:hypothetical protein
MKRSQKRARRWVLRELGRTLARRNGRSEAPSSPAEVGHADPEPAEIALPERAPKLIFACAAAAFPPVGFAAFMTVAARQLAAPAAAAAGVR